METVDEVTDSRAFSDFCEVESGNQVSGEDIMGKFQILSEKRHSVGTVRTGHRTFYAARVREQKYAATGSALKGGKKNGII